MDRFVGKRLDGRYEIQEIIGVGGMAVVYKARDNQENRIVAIKILKQEFVSNEEFLRRFKNESKAIAMLSHPNIVDVYDVSFGDLIQYIVMEYIEGITLKEYIERQGSLRWKDAVHFTLQILKGLQHAHDKGIVHRDVKPQNIMVLADGTIKVTDFGIARFARSDQRTITDKAIGSVHYISPEQARGEKTDEKADIYSVGVMLYEMLTGKMPFQAESAVSVAIMQLQRDPQLPTEINGSIPRGLEQITMHAMQKTAERRYQSAAEMLCDLDQFRKDPALTFEYSYFVDNSPTKYVGDIGNTEPQNELYIDTDDTKEKNNMIPILAGIAVALVLGIAVIVWFVIGSFNKSTGEEFKCPNFVGKSYEDVLANKEYAEKFKFIQAWDENPDFAYGIIYEQSESEGKMLKKPAEITLYISSGQLIKKVPDVYGKTESAAVTELKSNGFTTVIVEEPSDEYDKGMVVRTDPQRTERVPEGAEIKVYVSTGSDKKVDVPDVVGLPKETAQKNIEKAELICMVEEVYISADDKFYEIGYVVKQEPQKGAEEVAEGSTVKISVCKGYKFNVTVDELPIDFETESYYLTLWANGKMVNSGTKVNSSELSSYTFENIETTQKSLKLTVRISSGSKEYDLFDMSADAKSGKVKITKRYTNYPKRTSVPDSSITPPETTPPSTES